MYPMISDYKNAIIHLNKRALSLGSYNYVHENNFSPKPKFTSGTYAVVFKVKNTKNNCFYALKCFTKQVKQRKKRYKAISNYLKDKNISCFIDYEYLNNELYITSNIAKPGEYPVLKMDWIDGSTLGEIIEGACNNNDRNTLKQMISKWDNLCDTLIVNKIAHGDLKHDNIIVTNNFDLKLVDYDGMFVPKLKGLNATEIGCSSYQHPNRSFAFFNENLDYFSMIVIKISLIALYHLPKLYLKYNNGENIIFTKNDFLNISKSQLIKELTSINDEDIQLLIKLLIKLLHDNKDIYTKYKIIDHALYQEISKKNPAYFIIAIDNCNDMKINRGCGVPLQIIKSIITELLIDIQYLCTKNNIINEYFYISMINYNSKFDIINNSHFTSIKKNLEEIVQNAEYLISFEQAIQSIKDKVKRWVTKNTNSFSPTIINITTNYNHINNMKINQGKIVISPFYYNICNFYHKYNNNQLICFPKNVDECSHYKSLYDNTSTLPNCTSQYLNDTYGIFCNNCKGLLINTQFALILKFLHSTFKGPFYIGK